jgi:hypothetical protein
MKSRLWIHVALKFSNDRAVMVADSSCTRVTPLPHDLRSEILRKVKKRGELTVVEWNSSHHFGTPAAAELARGLPRATGR